MKTRIICIGKCKDQSIRACEDKYLERLRPPLAAQLVELSAASGEINDRRKKDTSLVLSKLTAREFAIVLDEQGQEMSSVEFADFLKKLMNQGWAGIAFLIGGAYGWDKESMKGAPYKFSLSKLTFPHELARLVLLEQLYRAQCILNGAPYHK